MSRLTDAERAKAREIGIAVFRTADGRYRVSPPTVDSLGIISIDLDSGGFITPDLEEVRECIRRYLDRAKPCPKTAFHAPSIPRVSAAIPGIHWADLFGKN